MLRIQARRFSTTSYRQLISKILPSANEAIQRSGLKSGATILAGGFGLCGIPDTLIDNIVSRKDNIRDLVIVSNNAGVDGKGLGKLLNEGQVDKAIVSYIGENKFFEAAYVNGDINLELTPQGTIAERIKAAANGVPAFYTPTGANTVLENGKMPIRYNKDGSVKTYSKPKETRIFNGKKYMLEEALRGDLSIIKVHKADRLGNCTFHSTAHNFNNVMARGSNHSIVEADEIVEVGEIKPNEIMLPGIYVSAVIQSLNPKQFEKVIYAKSEEEIAAVKSADHVLTKRERVAKRASLEFKEGMYVNLGLGIPLMAADFVDPSVDIQLQSENGVLGLGRLPYPGEEDPDTINAGKMAATLRTGAAIFGSEDSFGMIRSGRMDLTLLGAMQVSQNGDIANWTVPGKVKGMGGAMDLVANPEKTRVIACFEHVDKGKGLSKIRKECTLPLTGARCISRIITDLAVFDVDLKNGGLTLVEIAPDVTVEKLKEITDAEFKVAADLKKIVYH
ncbi:hypothetical protein DV113_004166 [Geotrichum candidum]|uniref:Succinyl-CoA:3-ketoacid-coenzyme A transferase n=1 Tax=Geotrichum candidum TaxID=1173061 RepID=A0A0J9YH80_GEOCN|nr:hypothetical protein DV113_004166 [Geotrichum candidum]KAI8133086.1 hypothetical protein DUD61_003260 [Geotrichum candidum]CDO51081.1 conserved hypothetical protein. Putative succinyl-CoA:3-ketoacid-coenzyme A transferase [Geotrichum candidum]